MIPVAVTQYRACLSTERWGDRSTVTEWLTVLANQQ